MAERATTLGAVEEVLRSADLLLGRTGAEDVAVRGVCQDSRRVRPGDLFLAWEGIDADAHDFAVDAVRWAAEVGITTGTTPTTFEPDGRATRGQAAAFFHRSSTLTPVDEPETPAEEG